VARASLSKTVAQVENCGVCQRLATPHLKNPKAPPDEKNPIVHFVLNKGGAGLDVVGDSIAVLPQGPHRSTSIKVTAPADDARLHLRRPPLDAGADQGHLTRRGAPGARRRRRQRTVKACPPGSHQNTRQPSTGRTATQEHSAP
jgi:hypothetical protein